MHSYNTCEHVEQTITQAPQVSYARDNEEIACHQGHQKQVGGNLFTFSTISTSQLELNDQLVETMNVVLKHYRT